MQGSTLCVLVIAAAAACGSSSRGTTDGPSGEVADAPPGMGGDGGPDDGAVDAGGAPNDANVDYGWGTCGTEVVGQGEFSRGGALAIGLDGTAYLSSFDAGKSWIARRVPGSSIDHVWFQFSAV